MMISETVRELIAVQTVINIYSVVSSKLHKHAQ